MNNTYENIESVGATIGINCPCGNTNPSDTEFYDGSLGYEAVVCNKCARYWDHSGEHMPDDWSHAFIAKDEA